MSWVNGELGGIAVTSYTQTSSNFSQRRRSSAAHTRPAAPPPNLPIPSIPYSEEMPSVNAYSGPSIRSSTFVGQQPSHSSASSSVDDLSDPPPQSILPASASRFHDPPPAPPQTADNLAVPAADGHLMPPETRPETRVPSPRRALTRALELAREAVQLDSMNDNPELAVAAYGRSVALLSEVMERVKRGEESTESSSRRKSGRRRSVFAQEDEIRRLQAIVSRQSAIHSVAIPNNS